MDKFDETFEKLKAVGKNNVDGIISWMKECNVKLIDDSKETEEKVRKLFADVKNDTNVELEKFREAISNLAADQKKSIGDMTKLLTEQGPKLISAFKAGASAFKEAFEKK